MTAPPPAGSLRRVAEARTDGNGTRTGRVLVVWYSQTGQLRRVAESVVAPLEEAGHEVRWVRLAPRKAFPFPWSAHDFLSVFPDTAALRACPIEAPDVPEGERFDLVVFAYTVWYLSPSLPAQAFFRSPAREVLRDTPVVTLIACRNMWFSAERIMRRLIRAAGGRHAGTIAVTDDGPAWATFVTTPRWLLSGRRDRWLRIFPPAGISDETIAASRRFGEAIAARGDLLGSPAVGSALRDVEPLSVDRPMVLPDLLLGRVFRVWAATIQRLSPPGGLRRRLVTFAFGGWLVATVPVVVGGLVLLRLVAPRTAERLTERYLAPLAALPEALAALPPAEPRTPIRA